MHYIYLFNEKYKTQLDNLFTILPRYCIIRMKCPKDDFFRVVPPYHEVSGFGFKPSRRRTRPTHFNSVMMNLLQ